MAHFYAGIKGNRGDVHRLGTKNSGASAVVASWQGAVEVYTWHDETTGLDMVEVKKRPWKNG